MTYPDTLLFIDGAWRPALAGDVIAVDNPATGERIGAVSKAGIADLDLALAAAERGFRAWKRTPARDRAAVLNAAAKLIRERAEAIARLMTLEHGKPLAEARGETLLAGDVMEWFAGETIRSYGRLIPARAPNVLQMVIKEPVGVAAGFTPWNFPINQTVRKISAALGAGCSIIIKGPEETPASPAALVACFADAGLPPGVLGLVYGLPAEISNYLIPHPTIRKVSFTGSVPVGKQLAAMAGQYMKRATMELGGHAPVIVAQDADPVAVSRMMAANKFRASGQSCASPTRFIVHQAVYDRFLAEFLESTRAVKVGDGLDPATTMGPVVSLRRLEALQALTADAVEKGATLEIGGGRIGTRGYFFEPTVLTGVTPAMRVMNDEPFGPIALIRPYTDLDDALSEANRLPVGLAAYAFTQSDYTASRISSEIDAGLLTINHLGLTLPETPFGGIGDSGYGSEGGSEAIEAYLVTKFVSRLSASAPNDR